METQVLKRLRLRQGAFEIDGRPLCAFAPGPAFFGEAYAALLGAYPKFFKMDAMSKTAVLAARALLAEVGFEGGEAAPRVGVVLYTRDGCAATDRLFQQTLAPEAYFPSPALFTYTLPNLAMGELCIRFKLTGENVTFAVPSFRLEDCLDYVGLLARKGTLDYCLCGWVNHNGEEAEADLYWVALR